MSSRPAIMLIILFCGVMFGAMQQTPSGASQAATSQANMAQAAESAQMKRFSPADDAKAREDDIKRMRSLVNQMQANLAFVDNSQSPLKHQFELEIQAWRVLIDQMERRAQANVH